IGGRAWSNQARPRLVVVVDLNRGQAQLDCPAGVTVSIGQLGLCDQLASGGDLASLVCNAALFVSGVGSINRERARCRRQECENGQGRNSYTDKPLNTSVAADVGADELVLRQAM